MRRYKSWSQICLRILPFVLALFLIEDRIWRAIVLLFALPLVLEVYNPLRESVMTGMETVYVGNETLIDVVAVQGLGSSYPNTWCGKRTVRREDGHREEVKVNWLADEDLLPGVLRGARIMAFKYNSNWLFDANHEDLNDHANDLLFELIKARKQCHPARPILFIGHSYGGIVIKKALVLCSQHHKQPDHQNILHAKRGIVFLGTPHQGASLAFFAQILCFLYRPFGAAYTGILNILSDPARLSQLENDIRSLLDKPYHHSVCVYETKGGKGFFSSGPLVPDYSAVLNGVDKLKMECDHASLNKFTGPEDPRYQLLVEKLKKISLCLTNDSQCGFSGCDGVEGRLLLGERFLFMEHRQLVSSSEITIKSSNWYDKNSGFTSINLVDASQRILLHMSFRGSYIALNTSNNGDYWDEEKRHDLSHILGQGSFTSFKIRSLQDHYCLCFNDHKYIRFEKRQGYMAPAVSMSYSHSLGSSGFSNPLLVDHPHSINNTEGDFFQLYLGGDVVLPEDRLLTNSYEITFQSSVPYNTSSGFTAINLFDSSYRILLHISLRGSFFVLTTSPDGVRWDKEERHKLPPILEKGPISEFTVRSLKNYYYICFGNHTIIEFKKRKTYTGPASVVSYSHSYGTSGFSDILLVKCTRSPNITVSDDEDWPEAG